MDSKYQVAYTSDQGALAGRLGAWLREAGVEQSEVAVDFADTVMAGRSVEAILSRLVSLRPESPQDGEEALRLLGELHTWIFGEMKFHIQELERAWPRLEEKLGELAPD